jgi:hypothetical protein
MSNDNWGNIKPQFLGPRMQPVDHTPEVLPEVPAPTYGFDAAKLHRIMETARQAGMSRRDIAERIRDARNRLANLRSSIEADMYRHGTSSPTRLQAGAVVEQEIQRLMDEQRVMDAKADATLAVAHNCETWARGQGWTPDGMPPALPVPPGVANAAGV